MLQSRRPSWCVDTVTEVCAYTWVLYKHNSADLLQTNIRFKEKRKWLTSYPSASFKGKAAGGGADSPLALVKTRFPGFGPDPPIQSHHWGGAWSRRSEKLPGWFWSLGSHYSLTHLLRSPHLSPWLSTARFSCSVEPLSFPGNCPRAGPPPRAQVYLSSFSVNPVSAALSCPEVCEPWCAQCRASQARPGCEEKSSGVLSHPAFLAFGCQPSNSLCFRMPLPLPRTQHLRTGVSAANANISQRLLNVVKSQAPGDHLLQISSLLQWLC